MELIKGRTLRQVLDDGRVPIDELLALALQIADALDAAHAAGLVHRDIKPSNIVVTDRGQAKILDFGLAKAPPPAPDASTAAGAPGDLTAIGALVGTVPYMSPEQVRGEPLDERSDLFSLGIVLYEMATGRHPFGGAPGAVALSAIQREPPVPASRLVPDVPSDLERVIGRLLEKDRDLRYQSAAGLAAELKRLVRDRAGAAGSTVARVGSALTRRTAWIAVGAVLPLPLLVEHAHRRTEHLACPPRRRDRRAPPGS
jgi:serine/threonine protein kinase